MMILTPRVLECMHFASSSLKEDKRTVTNYEFDLYLDGNHRIRLDGEEYNDTEGCLIFRHPGQITSGRGNYNMYILTLDFGGAILDGSSIFRPVTGPLQPECDFPELELIPSVFRPYHFDELKDLMEKLSKCSYPNVENGKQQEQYIKEFLLLVLHDSVKHCRAVKQETDTNRHIKNACEYISKNFTKDITVRNIADYLHVTENHLIKLFKKELDQTPSRYILELRLIHARYLILYSDLSVKEIAYLSGFNTPSYFSKCFSSRFGVLPNQMRTNKVSAISAKP